MDLATDLHDRLKDALEDYSALIYGAIENSQSMSYTQNLRDKQSQLWGLQSDLEDAFEAYWLKLEEDNG